jgi:hypothetical protein
MLVPVLRWPILGDNAHCNGTEAVTLSTRESPAGRSLCRRALPAIAAVAACCAGVALAADWPKFKPGQWQFDRTIEGTGPEPQKLSRVECTDPTDENRKQRAMLTQAGCQFTPVAEKGSTYTYSATCRIGNMTSTSRSTLVADGDEAYTVTIDSETDGAKTHEVLAARRLGDCPK